MENEEKKFLIFLLFRFGEFSFLVFTMVTEKFKMFVKYISHFPTYFACVFGNKVLDGRLEGIIWLPMNGLTNSSTSSF